MNPVKKLPTVLDIFHLPFNKPLPNDFLKARFLGSFVERVVVAHKPIGDFFFLLRPHTSEAVVKVLPEQPEFNGFKMECSFSLPITTTTIL